MSSSLNYTDHLLLILSRPSLAFTTDLISRLIIPYVLTREKVVIPRYTALDTESFILPSFPTQEDWLGTEYSLSSAKPIDYWPSRLCSLFEWHFQRRSYKSQGTQETWIGTPSSTFGVVPLDIFHSGCLKWTHTDLCFDYPKSFIRFPNAQVGLTKEGREIWIWIKGEVQDAEFEIWKVAVSKVKSSIGEWELVSRHKTALNKPYNHIFFNGLFMEVHHDRVLVFGDPLTKGITSFKVTDFARKGELFDHYWIHPDSDGKKHYVVDLLSRRYVAIIQDVPTQSFIAWHLTYYDDQAKRKYFICLFPPLFFCFSST